MKYLLPLVAALALAATTVSTAVAGGSKGANVCVQYNKITHVTKCYPKGTVVTPVAHPLTPPGTGTTGTPGTPTPPVVSPTPVTPSGAHAEFFCVQTEQRGNTAVQAYDGAFDANGAWRALTVAGATLDIAGHTVTLMWEGGKGVIVAPVVPGVGPTCDQPYVSTDGVVANQDWLVGLAPIVA